MHGRRDFRQDGFGRYQVDLVAAHDAFRDQPVADAAGIFDARKHHQGVTGRVERAAEGGAHVGFKREMFHADSLF
ncbi:hypothetical protein D3C73_1564660 [compost metagenome]